VAVSRALAAVWLIAGGLQGYLLGFGVLRGIWLRVPVVLGGAAAVLL